MSNHELATGIGSAKAGLSKLSGPDCNSAPARREPGPLCLLCPHFLAGSCANASTDAGIGDRNETLLPSAEETMD